VIADGALAGAVNRRAPLLPEAQTTTRPHGGLLH
jgi:hypothetical protein